MKGKIAWRVVNKDYPNIIELHLQEPPDYIMDNEYQYIVQKIVYFEVE